jgi:hypothetical protein
VVFFREETVTEVRTDESGHTRNGYVQETPKLSILTANGGNRMLRLA